MIYHTQLNLKYYIVSKYGIISVPTWNCNALIDVSRVSSILTLSAWHHEDVHGNNKTCYTGNDSFWVMKGPETLSIIVWIIRSAALTFPEAVRLSLRHLGKPTLGRGESRRPGSTDSTKETPWPKNFRLEWEESVDVAFESGPATPGWPWLWRETRGLGSCRGSGWCWRRKMVWLSARTSS